MSRRLTGDNPSPLNQSLRVIDRDSSIVERTRNKVAIVGGGMSRNSVEAVSVLENPEYEVWGCNAMDVRDRHGRFRADRWFELHPIEAQTETEMHWLRDCPLPFYMFMPAQHGHMTPHERYVFNMPLERGGRDGRNFIDPRSCGLTQTLVRYPMGRATRIRKLFPCTFAWQMALALMEGFETIALLGVDLPSGTQRERCLERPGVEWWIGFAEGLKRRIELPKSTTLNSHPYLYGASYWTEADFGRNYCLVFNDQEVAL